MHLSHKLSKPERHPETALKNLQEVQPHTPKIGDNRNPGTTKSAYGACLHEDLSVDFMKKN